jgi:hypothetical protein
MKFKRFSIRDLLWLALVVALVVGWTVSYRALDARYEEAKDMELQFKVFKDQVARHPAAFVTRDSPSSKSK